MDLDGDGRLDIITGSYSPGNMYFFRRTEDGFAKGEILQGADSKPLLVGNASTPFAFDWDGDGVLDLLVGDVYGHVWVVPGTGKLKFGTPAKLSHGGKEIKVGGGDSQPVMADWDGDGKADLVLAQGDGAVAWYRNTAEKGVPKLADPQTLLAKSTREFGKPGMRAKISVTDYNGDGQPDLLVGDYNYRQVPPADITEEQKKEAAELEKRQRELSEAYMAVYTKLYEAAIKKTGKKEEDLSKEELLQVRKDVAAELQNNEDYKKYMTEMREISVKMQKYRGTSERLGNVWVYARKAKAPVTGN